MRADDGPSRTRRDSYQGDEHHRRAGLGPSCKFHVGRLGAAL